MLVAEGRFGVGDTPVDGSQLLGVILFLALECYGGVNVDVPRDHINRLRALRDVRGDGLPIRQLGRGVERITLRGCDVPSRL